MEVEFTNYKIFWEIAIKNHNKVIKYAKEKNEITKTTKLTNNTIDFICMQNAKIEKYAIITIVFSIMTLESFINNYATKHYSITYFKNYLDNLNLKSKILLIPKLISNEQIDTGSEAFCLFIKTLKLRDKLVHDKTKKIDVSKPFDYEWVAEEESKNAIESVIKIVKDLHDIDSNIDKDWINDVKNNNY